MIKGMFKNRHQMSHLRGQSIKSFILKMEKGNSICYEQCLIYIRESSQYNKTRDINKKCKLWKVGTKTVILHILHRTCD